MARSFWETVCQPNPGWFRQHLLPWMIQVMSTSLSGSFQLENAGNFESGSTSASALVRGPLAAVTMCDVFTSREWGISVGRLLNWLQQIKIIKYWTWRGNTCSTDMLKKELHYKSIVAWYIPSSHSSFNGYSGELFCWLKTIILNESISRTQGDIAMWKIQIFYE